MSTGAAIGREARTGRPGRPMSGLGRLRDGARRPPRAAPPRAPASKDANGRGGVAGPPPDGSPETCRHHPDMDAEPSTRPHRPDHPEGPMALDSHTYRAKRRVPMSPAGLYRVKPAAQRRLRPLEDALVARGVSADALTAAAVLLAVAGGACLALGDQMPAPVPRRAAGSGGSARIEPAGRAGRTPHRYVTTDG